MKERSDRAVAGELTSAQKAAVLVMTLDDDKAAELLK